MEKIEVAHPAAKNAGHRATDTAKPVAANRRGMVGGRQI